MRIGTAGRICLVGGLVGAVQATVMLAVSPTVSDDRYSYPFDTTGYVRRAVELLPPAPAPARWESWRCSACPQSAPAERDGSGSASDWSA